MGARRDPLGICAWRSIAHRILVRVELPFILHWFKNRLPAITNLAGRLSMWMLGKMRGVGKWKGGNSWQVVCNQSNAMFTRKGCVSRESASSDEADRARYLILLGGCECILGCK